MNFKTSVKIKGKEKKKQNNEHKVIWKKITNIKQYTPRTVLVVTAHSVKNIFLLTEGA